VKVGGTEYQYPPRKYDIPEGLTKREGNTVVIRLCVENGCGRITPDKEYRIFNEDAGVGLDGPWKYKVGARCDECIPPTDFINWKSTGLYNAMTAPCHNYPVDGIVWYQGESNTYESDRYVDLSRRMIKGYRKMWGEENLPYIFVQLPNFVIDAESINDPWPRFRLAQKELLDDPDVGMAVTMDVGEDNDLHPTMKEPIGLRLAVYAARLRYGYGGEYTGPEPESATVLDYSKDTGDINKKVTTIELAMTHCAGLHIKALDKGDEIKDFLVVSYDGTVSDASASVSGEKIILQTSARAGSIREIRYLDSYTYKGAMIYNSAGFPMGPFVLTVGNH
jgi:sialate O-acetylesterase